MGSRCWRYKHCRLHHEHSTWSGFLIHGTSRSAFGMKAMTDLAARRLRSVLWEIDFSSIQGVRRSPGHRKDRSQEVLGLLSTLYQTDLTLIAQALRPGWIRTGPGTKKASRTGKRIVCFMATRLSFQKEQKPCNFCSLSWPDDDPARALVVRAPRPAAQSSLHN